MIKLALDLATVTGWCYGAGGEPPALGTVTMPSTGEEIGPFLDHFFRWLHAKITEVQEEYELETIPGPFGARCKDPKALVACIEAPILLRDKWDPIKRKMVAQTNIVTTRKLQGLAGVAEMVFLQRGVPCSEVNVASVKKVMGSGGNTKPDMMAAAKRAGLNPKDHNAADAFGVWVLMLFHYDKNHFMAWDQKIRVHGEGQMI